MNEFLENVRHTVKNWWVSLVIGILAIILGIWALVTPDVTLVALTYLFIIGFFVSGIFEIFFAVSNKDTMTGWGWNLAGGIIDLVFGIILLLMPPVITAITLVYFVGFWIIFRSVWMIGDSIELKRLGVSGWGWLLALAILAILFALAFLISPLFTGAAVIIGFVAAALIVYGVFRVYLAFQLRSVYKDIKN